MTSAVGKGIWGRWRRVMHFEEQVMNLNAWNLCDFDACSCHLPGRYHTSLAFGREHCLLDACESMLRQSEKEETKKTMAKNVIYIKLGPGRHTGDLEDSCAATYLSSCLSCLRVPFFAAHITSTRCFTAPSTALKVMLIKSCQRHAKSVLLHRSQLQLLLLHRLRI